MGVDLTAREGAVLCDLLCEYSQDFIVKTSREGFIVHGSPGMERLGLAGAGALVGPHLADLAQPSHGDAIRRLHADVIAGRRNVSGDARVDFPARMADGANKWFALSLRALENDAGAVYGALGVMRCIDERRSLEERLFTSSMTDSLTGLTNRHAFTMMLQHLVERGAGGGVILFDIDRFKAINLEHGQSVGDEVLRVFADFLRVMTRSSDIISRIDGESFALLLPYATMEEACALGKPIIETLEDIRQSIPGQGVSITASGGVAAIGATVDQTMRDAELSLFMAKTRGGGCLHVPASPVVSALSGSALSGSAMC